MSSTSPASYGFERNRTFVSATFLRYARFPRVFFFEKERACRFQALCCVIVRARFVKSSSDFRWRMNQTLRIESAGKERRKKRRREEVARTSSSFYFVRAINEKTGDDGSEARHGEMTHLLLFLRNL